MSAADALSSVLRATASGAVDVQWSQWDADGEPVLCVESSCTAARGADKSGGSEEVGGDCSSPKDDGDSSKCGNCVTRLHFTNRAAVDLEFPSQAPIATPRSGAREPAVTKQHQPEATRVRKCAAYTHVAWLSYDEQKPLSAKLLKVKTRYLVFMHPHNYCTSLHTRAHLLCVLFVPELP